jgi:hypothetical protein
MCQAWAQIFNGSPGAEVGHTTLRGANVIQP